MTHLDEKALAAKAWADLEFAASATVALEVANVTLPIEKVRALVNERSALPSSPVSELVERLEKRAKEDEECAENNRVVADLLSPELAKFNGRDEAGWNTYAVRTAVDHRKSMERDSRYSTDLREAASALTALTTLSTRNADLEREVKRLREAQQWQPIETAPKDGLVDIWIDHGDGTGVRRCDCYYDRICDEWRTSRPLGRLLTIKARHVTHWMSPPALSTSPQGGEHE